MALKSAAALTLASLHLNRLFQLLSAILEQRKSRLNPEIANFHIYQDQIQTLDLYRLSKADTSTKNDSEFEVKSTQLTSKYWHKPRPGLNLQKGRVALGEKVRKGQVFLTLWKSLRGITD